jgi:hypothetical protein
LLGGSLQAGFSAASVNSKVKILVDLKKDMTVFIRKIEKRKENEGK